jgi:hypothetical protein
MDIRKLKAGDIALSVAVLAAICLTVAYVTHQIKEERRKWAVREFLVEHRQEWQAFQKANPELRAIVMHSNTALPGTIRIDGAVADKSHLDKVAVFLFRHQSPYGTSSHAVRIVPEAEVDRWADGMR